MIVRLPESARRRSSRCVPCTLAETRTPRSAVLQKPLPSRVPNVKSITASKGSYIGVCNWRPAVLVFVIVLLISLLPRIPTGNGSDGGGGGGGGGSED